MNELSVQEAGPDELALAIELALDDTPPAGGSRFGIAAHFLRYLRLQHLEITWAFVIKVGRHPAGSCVGIASPGRAGMVLISSCDPGTALFQGIVAALGELERAARHRGLRILQALVRNQAHGAAQALQQAGYVQLANLRYLSRRIASPQPACPRPAELTIDTWQAAAQDAFVTTLSKTYEESLDCPGLNNIRTIEDILQSHRHTGIHDPTLWLLASAHHRPVGVLLLTQVPLRSALEIVYLGVIPQARRRAYGKTLVHLAINQAAQRRCEHLILAVDDRNLPALRLYGATGFETTEERRAWILDLHARP